MTTASGTQDVSFFTVGENCEKLKWAQKIQFPAHLGYLHSTLSSGYPTTL